MTRVAIITANYKHNEMTYKFLENLFSLKNDTLFHVYLTMATEDGVPIQHTCSEWMLHKEDSHLHTITTVKNQGFSHSMNTSLRCAIEHGPYDYYLVIGNDGFPQEDGWLDKLIETQIAHGSWITCPEHDNPPIEAYQRHFLFAEGHVKYYKMFPAVCWLIADTVISEIGLFDEQFVVGCYEDDDYARRVLNAGGHIVVDTRVKLHHLLSQTMGLFNVAEAMNKNNNKFQEKWR